MRFILFAFCCVVFYCEVPNAEDGTISAFEFAQYGKYLLSWPRVDLFNFFISLLHLLTDRKQTSR